MFRCTKGTKSWHIRRAVKPGTRTRMLLHIAEAHKTQLGRQMTDAHKYVLNTCCSPIWPHTAPSSARARNKLLRTRWPAHSGYGRSYTYAPHPPRVLGTSIWQRREHFVFYAFSYWLAVLICFQMSNRPKNSNKRCNIITVWRGEQLCSFTFERIVIMKTSISKKCSERCAHE
jgi:hypothetical protein